MCKLNPWNTSCKEANNWKVTGLPKGRYRVTAIVNDEANKSEMNLQANSVKLFDSMMCDKCHFSHTEVLFQPKEVDITEGVLELTDECHKKLCWGLQTKIS